MEIKTNKYASWALSPLLALLAAGFAVYCLGRCLLTGEQLVIEVEEVK